MLTDEVSLVNDVAMELGRQPVIPPSAYVAPSATLIGNVVLGERSVIMFGVVLRADVAPILIGDETNVQDNSVLHGEPDIPTVVGNRVTIGHSAVVHGAKIDDRCLVAIGAKALTGSEMGEGSWLAAGAVLAEGRSIPPWTLAVGVPAKPLRELTEAEVRRQVHGMEAYLELARKYRVTHPREPRD